MKNPAGKTSGQATPLSVTNRCAHVKSDPNMKKSLHKFYGCETPLSASARRSLKQSEPQSVMETTDHIDVKNLDANLKKALEPRLQQVQEDRKNSGFN